MSRSSSPDLENRLSDSAVSSDDAFEILSNEYNRMLLYLLCDRGGTITISEVVEQLSTWESTSEQSVSTRLYHSCLPKLEDREFITYDRETKAVTFSEKGEQLRPYLNFAMSQEVDEIHAFLEETRRSTP